MVDSQETGTKPRSVFTWTGLLARFVGYTLSAAFIGGLTVALHDGSYDSYYARG
jgi:hypothetical protein